MEDRILTMHPSGKQGVNILYRRYNRIKDYILSTIRSTGVITFSDLADQAVEELSDNFDGKVLWYVTTVKLDLEARGLIERVPKTSPHQLRLTEKASG
ncbi:MAG: hypothetical protein R3301_05555 [Saprospiraceae bacterium]|nr:hypothetical protein [Saprospiraceae bacterium]